jgi:hypothetical protein
MFQAFLNLDYLQNGPFYFGAATIRVSGHVAVNDGAGCGQFIQRLDLLELGFNPHIQRPGL